MRRNLSHVEASYWQWTAFSTFWDSSPQSPFKERQSCESLCRTMVTGIHPSLKRWKRCGSNPILTESSRLSPGFKRELSDTKVVSGYISNDAKRFYDYVSYWVLRLRSFSSPEQWEYIPTDVNLADIATRSVSAAHLSSTSWLCGPLFLKQNQQTDEEECSFELVNPSSDAEIRPLVSTMKKTMSSNQLRSQRFSQFSNWKSLIHASLILLVSSRKLLQLKLVAGKAGITATRHFQLRNSQELRDLSFVQFKRRHMHKSTPVQERTTNYRETVFLKL